MFRRKLEPDLDRFHEALKKSVNVDKHDGTQVAKDFRRLFMGRGDPDCGKRVLFMLMTWMDEYETQIPTDDAELQRYAARRELAQKIKAALHANLEGDI